MSVQAQEDVKEYSHTVRRDILDTRFGCAALARLGK